MDDDPYQIPNYTDMIVIPFRIPWRTASGERARRASGQQRDGAQGGSAGATAPDRSHGFEPPHPAVAGGATEARIMMASVQGQPALAVSGISDGALTLWRRGGGAAAPQALATFTVDLDGSLRGAGGKFLGWLFADDRALLDPDWLRSVGANAPHQNEQGFDPLSVVSIVESGQEAAHADPGGEAAPRSNEVTSSDPNPIPDPDANLTLSETGVRFLFNHEAQPGVSGHTHHPPNPTSGVTIGPGYDMGSRTARQVQEDLRAIGVDASMAETLSGGAGLRGAAAEAFAHRHALDIALTEAQQYLLMNRVLEPYQNAVRSTVQVPLNQNQFDALVSYAYNRGTSGFRSSRVVQLLNSGRIGEVPDELRRGNTGGLISRRNDEAALFETPPPPLPGASMP